MQLSSSQQRALDALYGFPLTPYLVADCAFGLTDFVMKCYETANPSLAQFNFNYAVIRTRRVVENAFGRLKGRFHIMHGNCRFNDTDFCANVAMVCCALHNFIEHGRIDSSMRVFEREQNRFTQYFEHVAFDPSGVERDRATRDEAGACSKRDTLATYAKDVLRVVPAVTDNNSRRNVYNKDEFNAVLGFGAIPDAFCN